MQQNKFERHEGAPIVTSDPRLALIERLQNSIHDCLNEFMLGEPFALVDFPNYRNVGDSAIWLGEIAYFKSRFGQAPAYVSEISDFSADALEKAAPTGPIFIHGGGNFGDVWVRHQEFREEILKRWPDRLIIQLPQSIHYSSSARADETAKIIEKNKNFVLLVRDEESKLFADTRFNCDVRLCSDMALCIGALSPAAPTYPILAMLRTDKEKAGSYDLAPYPDMPVEDWLNESKIAMRVVKLLARARSIGKNGSDAKLEKFNAAAGARLARGVKQLSRGRAIVTDRLHVHIVSLLLGIPHAAMDNSYGKIGRFMAAFSGGTTLSYRAGSLDDAVAWATMNGRS